MVAYPLPAKEDDLNLIPPSPGFPALLLRFLFLMR